MEIILITLTVLIVASVILVVRHKKRNAVKPVSGGVYTIKNSSGKFLIIKVLALSKKGYAHYLQYPSEMIQRPQTLQISVMADKPSHNKAEINKFHKMAPQMIGRIKINSREIQRYLRPKAS
ncbi:MAG: hypothetical protein AAFQ94_17225 [Bacteroidota bacterium]